MGRRQEEYQGKLIVEALEMLSGKRLPANISEEISAGADEIALVRSGLDDTMRLAYQEISKVFHGNSNINDFRTAGFVIALQKIARTYLDMGI